LTKGCSLDKQRFDQVEEAVALIERGAETFASCAVRYGAAWSEIENAVEMSIQLRRLGRAHRETTRIFDKQLLWQKISAGMELPKPLNNAADSGTNLKLEHSKIIKFVDRPKSKKLVILTRVAAMLLIFSLLSSLFMGVAQASEPGDWLYDTKLVLDEAKGAVAFTNDDKAIHWLDFANNRLSEIERRANRQNYNGLAKAISAYKHCDQNSDRVS
jgi:Domain of unknown function (DUF5667)